MEKTTLPIALFILLTSSALFGQSTAIYDITVSTIWNATDHTSIPNDPHWSPLSGGTHKNADDILKFGEVAPITDGIKDVAETGSTSNFKSEIEGNPNANQYLQQGFSPRGASGSMATLSGVNVSENYPYITLVSMVAPSPDWFIAINSENLRSGDTANNGWKATYTVDMFAYDAGTDSGTDYESANSVTAPRTPIGMISGAPINGNRMGTITFTYISSTLSNDRIGLIENIKVFPNPAKGKLSLINLENISLKSVEIFSVLGKLSKSILVENHSNQIEMDLSDLPPGIYLLKLQDKSGSSKIQKLILQ